MGSLDDTTPLQYLEFRCAFGLAGAPTGTRDCEPADFVSGWDGSPFACFVETECAGKTYTVDCGPADEGVSCTCSIDGEGVIQVALDADGCAGAAMFGDDADSDPIQVMDSICGW